MRDALAAHNDLHTADGAQAHTRVTVVSGYTARQGRCYDIYAMAAGGVQGLQALSPRHWPSLGAFIKLPALRVVHDLSRPGALCDALLPRHHRERTVGGTRDGAAMELSPLWSTPAS